MELRHLHYFLVLAEELHFGRAAKRLFISQPPLSRQIKQLEDELGAVLFRRENKRVSLTAAGQYLLEAGQSLTDQVALIKTRVYDIGRSVAGEIKIGYISAVDKLKLGLFIQDMQQDFPHVQSKLFELSTERQLEALHNGQLDLAIVRAPIHTPGITLEKLYQETFCMAYSADFKLPADYSTLQQQAFITYNAEDAPIYHSNALSFCAALGFSPTIRHECNTISSILELVHLNIGISIVPQSVKAQYQHLAIKYLDLENQDINTTTLLAYRQERMDAVLANLRKLIIKNFKG